MRIPVLFVVALFAADAAATEETLPTVLATGNSPAYPHATHLTAVGSSSSSIQDAEAAARVEIARQVRSTITSDFSSTLLEVESAGGTQLQRTDSSRRTITAAFSANHLIQTVPELAGRYNGLHYAFAVLEREKSVQFLEREYERSSSSYRTQVAQLKALAEQPLELKRSIRTTLSALEALISLGQDIEGLTERAYPPLSHDVTLWHATMRAASPPRTSQTVMVFARSAPEGREFAARSAFGPVLDRLALTDTTARESAGLKLSLRIDEQRYAFVGLHYCDWNVQLEVCGCETQQCRAGQFTGCRQFMIPKLSAADPVLESSACDALVARIPTDPNVLSTFRKAFEMWLPPDLP